MYIIIHITIRKFAIEAIKKAHGITLLLNGLSLANKKIYAKITAIKNTAISIIHYTIGNSISKVPFIEH